METQTTQTTQTTKMQSEMEYWFSQHYKLTDNARDTIPYSDLMERFNRRFHLSGDASLYTFLRPMLIAKKIYLWTNVGKNKPADLIYGLKAR